ncbi:sigma-70 family RNA polymerase sigma factor [Streptomyces sp. H28]|uniref:sigma-70 family RNA polymerase sigma factor n=1 Tax=Streptomyces sp. H28 TaxID=2775865 RepID=UPI00177F1645|nr:sigma-70 family RNA polymerase sigma factor [Streptomyces sp. H28]MBD9730880.1 sigma-70 family RNA polymerase sigma factor [Streptomyces sp. H28]
MDTHLAETETAYDTRTGHDTGPAPRTGPPPRTGPAHPTAPAPAPGTATGTGASGGTTPGAIDDLEDATSLFLSVRPSLFRTAHRIVGDASEAEDVLQDVWLRLRRTDRRVVHSPAALLRTITVRLAINAGQSARRRREYPATPWLPEPPGSEATPEAAAERQEAVEQAVALLLERLTPRQRAAFVLREGFGYPHTRIAGLLHLSVVNSRQHVARAHQRLAGAQTERTRQPADAAMHRRFVRAFLAAAQTGRLADLEQLLLDDTLDDPADRTGAAPPARAA